MKPDSVFRILLLLILLTLLPTASHAQVVQSLAVSSDKNAVRVEGSQSLPPDAGEVTILRDDFAGKYNTSTLENLSQLYWRLGAFDLEDTEAIANYLKINECKLYTEYINDDLEWKEILNTMKKHIEMKRNTFPLNFQFVLELHLGRYDPAQGGFPIIDKTGFKNAKRVEVNSVDSRRSICFDVNPVKDYPKNLIILLPKPFTLDFLKLDEHVAQAYILRKKSEYSNMSDDMRLRRYERDAYLRLRVTFSQYHGNLRGVENLPMSILFGTVDGYEIFEDVNQKRLMLSVNMDQASNDAAQPEMSTPVEPLSDLAKPAMPDGKKNEDVVITPIPKINDVTVPRPKTSP